MTSSSGSSSSKSQDNQLGYMDGGVSVKISEHYKPPPRINLAISYAQRLTLNQQIEDNLPEYDFVLEKTVKEKMSEWRTARQLLFDEQKTRLEQARINEAKRSEQLDNDNHDDDDDDNNSNGNETNQILIPTQVNTTDILKPIQLTEYNKINNSDKSPFNISDFEADTSSPFDNMALKSINDMEELALVLKKEPSYNNTTLPQQQQQQNYIYPNYTYIPNCSTSYVNPITSVYSQTNGYYYPNYPTTYSSYTTTPSTTTINRDFSTSTLNSYQTPTTIDKTIDNKVPNIIKSLNEQLNHIHIDNNKTNLTTNTSESSRSDKNDDDDVDNLFDTLPKITQDNCRSISAMGFPLSRVVRVCKMIGNDQKKIVEHLLAMSELLVLGFPETNVTKALIQCNNDTDKALDLLTL